MIRTGVIGHLVLNHLEALAVRGVHQFAELGESAEVLFDAVEIHRAVAVIVGDALVVVSLALVQAVDVVVYRVDPDGGGAEILEIRQVIDDALEVAAMVVTRLLPVE
jgi:hypothetical protein